MIIDGHWMPIRDGDARGRWLFLRHYSSQKNNPVRVAAVGNAARYVGPGEKILLLTPECDAIFAWRKASFRQDGQVGIECSIFRNEGGVSSESLIREAETLAWSKWPSERLFTYVDPAKVATEVAGWCFIRARWRQRPDMTSASGKLLFEKLAGPSCRWPRREDAALRYAA